jgi:hypothetical protein
VDHKSVSQYDRNAQVTIFVLLGVVLILAVTGAVFLFQGEETSSADQANQQEEVTPITNAIRDCSVQLANEQIQRVARHGGYTPTETEDILTDHPEPYRNQGIEVFEDELTVPYWRYSEDSPDCASCTTTTEIPPLQGEPDSIATKVSDYVESNLESCVNNFQNFEDSYSISAGEPRVTIAFNEEDTSITTNWDITVQPDDADASFDINQVRGRSDAPVKRTYESARSVLQRIAFEDLFATYTSQVLSYLSFSETIPPVNGGTRFGFDFDTWQLSDVKQAIQSNLASYATTISVLGPNEPVPTYQTNSSATFARALTTSVQDEDIGDVAVDMEIRPDWPITVRVNGERSPVIMPDSFSNSASFFSIGITEYDFTYDVTNPVLVSITEDDVQGMDSLTWQFGVESNIRDSQPYTTTTQAVAGDSIESGDTVSFAGLGGNNVTVMTDGDTVSDSVVELTCAGESIRAPDNNPERPGYQVRLPTCVVGNLTVQGTLIQAEEKRVSITPSSDNIYEIDTSQLQNTTVSVDRYEMVEATEENKESLLAESPKGVLARQNSPVSAICPVCTVIKFDKLAEKLLSFLGADTGLEPPEYTYNPNPTKPLPNVDQRLIFTQQGSDYVQEINLEGSTSGTVDLYPGDYRVSLFSTQDLQEPLILEEEEICAGPAGTLCETVNGTQINDSLLVGYYDTKNTTVTVPSDNNTEITVPYFGYSQDDLEVTRDLAITSSMMNMSRRLVGKVKPVVE